LAERFCVEYFSKFNLVMSKIGRKLINLPSGVSVGRKQDKLVVKGPRGELALDIHSEVEVSFDDKIIKVGLKDGSQAFNLWGLFRSLIKNMVAGVSDGFVKQLEIEGVGYRFEVQGNKLTLQVGFSHPVIYNLPEGIQAKVEKNVLTISGIDKALVGQAAAEIRAIKKPEPYKGKGIRYAGEKIRRKEGKKAGSENKS